MEQTHLSVRESVCSSLFGLETHLPSLKEMVPEIADISQIVRSETHKVS